MKTFDFVTHVTANVRIDAETEEEARAEYEEQVAHEVVFLTATQDQILVVKGLGYEPPTEYVEPEFPEESTEEVNG